MTITRQIKLLTAILLAATSVVSLRAQTNAPAQVQTNAPIDKPKWQSSAAAGLTITRGNSETMVANMSAFTERKTKENEFSAGMDGTYGDSTTRTVTATTTNNTTTVNANAVHGFLQYNRLFNDRLFAYVRTEALHDEIALVTYRVTLSPGAGYYLIKQKGTDFRLEMGPSYIIQKLDDEGQKDYATLRVADKFTHEISDRARMWQTAEILPSVEHFKNYIINAEIGIEADLTKDKKFTLRTFLDDTYDSAPATGRKKNDIKLATALAYKF